MIKHLKWIVLLWILCISEQGSFAQNYSSLDNYTGSWESASSWDPLWPVPESDVTGHDITNDPIYPFFQSTCSVAIPDITADGPTSFCIGGSVALTSSPGTTYLWSTGATTSSINVTTSGNYTVQVTNADGCQSAASVPTIVTVNALPATPTITAEGPTTFCDGGYNQFSISIRNEKNNRFGCRYGR